MFHRFPSPPDDPQMTGGTRLTKEVVSLVKLTEAENFFGNEIGPAAEIPSLPRKNSKLKKPVPLIFSSRFANSEN